jgi:signal transduction histidine kinase
MIPFSSSRNPSRVRKSEPSAFSRASPPFSTASASSDRAQWLRAEQIRAAYKCMPQNCVVAVVAGLIHVIAMSREVPTVTLVAWLAGLYAAASYALFLYLQYRRAAPSPDQARKWGTRITFAIFLAGCAWGSAGIVMFQPTFTGYQMYLVLGLFMVTFASGAMGYTPFLPLAYALAIPSISPLLIRNAMQGDFLHLMVTAAGLLLLVLVLYYAAEVNGVIRESFLLRNRAEEASRAKSRFLAAASHDLRQPLHTLSLYSASLKLHAPDGAAGEIANHINKALSSLSALVDSLLDISKLDAGAITPDMQSMSVTALIERIESDYREVAREKGLQFRISASEVFVESDPVLLERIIRNLVDNAFKYTAAGSITLAAETDDRTLRIAVRDTGPGIPAAEQERIFEEFYQIGNPERDRAQGLGLGLAIVRRLVHLLGLQLTLESQPARGSTFAIAMPYLFQSSTAHPRESAPRALAVDARGLDGARVLVVDDEPEVRSAIKTLLEYLGCRVAVCGGLVEAERVLDHRELEPDLIVADFRLRQHENGIDTVRKLRARLGDIPALLVTGDTAPERLREAQSSGLPLLHKPVSAEKLAETMVALLRR